MAKTFSLERDSDSIEAAFARSGLSTRVVGGTNISVVVGEEIGGFVTRFDLSGNGPNADVVQRVERLVGIVHDCTESTITVERRAR